MTVGCLVYWLPVFLSVPIFRIPAMASGRKKSIVSAAGLTIEPGNTLLNKAASQSTSLYQQCSSLRARLHRIHGFSHYFDLAAAADSRQSTDPVTQVWDLLSLGISLCFLFDKLPDHYHFPKIGNSEFNQSIDQTPERDKKRAIALFAIQINERVTQEIPGTEKFTVTDLWDRKSTDGLVKVRLLYRGRPVSRLPPLPGHQYRNRHR